MKLHHIPNIVTFTRIILLIPFLYTLLHEQYQASFYIFFFAGLSDGLDGWLARRFNWQSKLGGMLDPLSDKLFVSCSYLTLGYLGQIPWWLVLLVLGRDIIIMGGVSFYQYLYGPIEFHSTLLSKTNTVLQGCVVFSCVFQLGFMLMPVWLFQGLIFVTAATTAASCLHYIYLGCSMASKKLSSGK